MLSEPALPPPMPAVAEESSAEAASAGTPLGPSANSAAKKTIARKQRPGGIRIAPQSASDVDRKLGFEVISTHNDRGARPRAPACPPRPARVGARCSPRVGVVLGSAMLLLR